MAEVVGGDGLDELLRLAKAATSGPWFVVGLPWLDEDVPPYINAGSPDPHHDGFVCDMENMATSEARPNAEADAAFIAAANPAAVAALVERTRTAEAAGSSAEAEYRDLTFRLGFGDGITEPQADNDTIVRWFDARSIEAADWVELQSWRVDCLAAGHADDEDCVEHDPSLRLSRAESERDAARAELADAHRALDAWGYRARGRASLARARGDQVAERDALDDCALIDRTLAASRPSSPATEPGACTPDDVTDDKDRMCGCGHAYRAHRGNGYGHCLACAIPATEPVTEGAGRG